jgi:uncharacterized protein (TIGR02246 family)
MPAFLPEEVAILFAERFNSGDLDGAVSLFESEATFVAQPGQPVTGTQAIRGAAGSFMALNAKLRIDVQEVIRGANVALLRSHWTLAGTGPDGSAVRMEGQGIEVVRHQSDGTWRYVINQPYGAAS